MTPHGSSVGAPVKRQAGGSGRVGRMKVVDESGCRMMEGVLDLSVNLRERCIEAD